MATKFVTVSIEIMHDKKLTPNQKFILAEIHQLSSLEKGCIASNRHFSELIGITMSGVSKALNDLEEKGYIIINNSQTKRNVGRVITIDSGKSGIDSGKSGIDWSQESKENRTVNRTVNIKNKQKDLNLEEIESHNYKENILEFIQHRKDIKKPFTQLALTKFINKINKFINLNHNVVELIDNSITASYSDIYAPKQNNYKPQQTKQQKNRDFIDSYFAEQDKEADFEGELL